MFYLKVIRQIVLRGPLKLSIKERKQLMKWKVGSQTNQKLLHSDLMAWHQCLQHYWSKQIRLSTKAEQSSLDGKQSASQRTSKSIKFGSHVLLCSHMTQVSDGFRFPLVVKCGQGDRVVYHGQSGMMRSLPVQPQARALVKLGMSRIAAAATATTITRFQSPSLS